MCICYTTCAISIVFIVGMIYMSLAIDKTAVSKDFISVLNPKQRETYKKITNERRTLYMTGYGLGLLLSLIVLLVQYSYNIKMSKVGMACLTGAITFVISYFYYILSPKSDYMILHIEGDKQKTAWLKIYRTMQYHYHLSLFLGIVGVSLLGAGLCN